MAEDEVSPGAPEGEGEDTEDEMARAMAEAMAAEGQDGGEEAPDPFDAASNALAAGAEQVESNGLPDLEPQPAGEPLGNLDFILDVPLQITVTLGKARMLIKELLQLGQGSVVELEKMAGEPMDVLIGDKLVARGEVVVVNERFGVRLTDIVSATDRVKNLSQ